jgi:hypothetical protein
MIKTLFFSILIIFSINNLNVQAADTGPPAQIIKKTNPTYAEIRNLIKQLQC